ncbi:MAG: DUF503 domain-containing protein [Tissierellia bacterium]|nr:DUF503 domain-containing protein [Tissierellia bacterium]
MIVGACTLKLIIYESNSLKDKRHIVRSIIGRVGSRFNVSIAEIGLNDTWQTSIIGFACVTNGTDHANQILSKVINFIDGDSRVEIIDYNIEIM